MSGTELILDLLKDKQWHNFNEIYTKISDTISPERASQIYMNNGKKEERSSVQKIPLEIQELNGRKLFVQHALRDLLRKAWIECQDITIKNDLRQYRILPKESWGKDPSSHGRQVKCLAIKAVKEAAKSGISKSVSISTPPKTKTELKQERQQKLLRVQKRLSRALATCLPKPGSITISNVIVETIQTIIKINQED